MLAWRVRNALALVTAFLRGEVSRVAETGISLNVISLTMLAGSAFVYGRRFTTDGGLLRKVFAYFRES